MLYLNRIFNNKFYKSIKGSIIISSDINKINLYNVYMYKHFSYNCILNNKVLNDRFLDKDENEIMVPFHMRNDVKNKFTEKDRIYAGICVHRNTAELLKWLAESSFLGKILPKNFHYTSIHLGGSYA